MAPPRVADGLATEPTSGFEAEAARWELVERPLGHPTLLGSWSGAQGEVVARESWDPTEPLGAYRHGRPRPPPIGRDAVVPARSGSDRHIIAGGTERAQSSEWRYAERLVMRRGFARSSGTSPLVVRALHIISRATPTCGREASDGQGRRRLHESRRCSIALPLAPGCDALESRSQ